MIKNKKKFLIISLVIILSLISCGTFFLLKPTIGYSSILIGGSSTVHPYTLALAEEFMKDNNGTNIYCESGGSTPGLIAVTNGAIDISTMSRDLNDNEDNQYISNYLIGKDGIGIVVNPSNPLTNITVEQAKDIFSGAIDNWSILGGSDSKIEVIGRKPDSTTYKGFDEIVLKGAGLSDNAVITDSAAEVAKTIASNPDAIGFLALRDLNKLVKALDINGVPISRLTILTDRYPISRSFYFVFYDKPNNAVVDINQSSFFDKIFSFLKIDDDKAHQIKIETVQSFLTFVKSKKGQEIIEKNGAIAVY